MRIRRIWMIAVLSFTVWLSAGCELLDEKAWEPEETSLQMKKDGTLTETIMDRLDQSYYNAAELEDMIRSSVSEYNQDNGADSVVIDGLTIENQQITVTLTYHSAADYAKYNNVRFYNGSMLGAEMDGFLFRTSFKKVEKGKVTKDNVSNEEALRHKEYQVLVTDLSHVVQVPGNIEYVSANADLLGEREAAPGGDGAITIDGGAAGQDAEAASADSSPVTAEDLEKTYLYILYDY